MSDPYHPPKKSEPLRTTPRTQSEQASDYNEAVNQKVIEPARRAIKNFLDRFKQ